MLVFHLVPKCAFGHGAKRCGGFERYFAFAKPRHALLELGRQLPCGATEADTSRSHRRDPLPLAFADVAAFVFGNERKKLQDDFEQGEIKNPITSLQNWLNEAYPETAAYLAYRASRRNGGAR